MNNFNLKIAKTIYECQILKNKDAMVINPEIIKIFRKYDDVVIVRSKNCYILKHIKNITLSEIVDIQNGSYNEETIKKYNFNGNDIRVLKNKKHTIKYLENKLNLKVEVEL